MELTVVCEGSAPKSEIKPDDVYMILSKEGLFVYIGKDCSVLEKRNALSNAHVSGLFRQIPKSNPTFKNG